jgi:hypothetical protein
MKGSKLPGPMRKLEKLVHGKSMKVEEFYPSLV